MVAFSYDLLSGVLFGARSGSAFTPEKSSPQFGPKSLSHLSILSLAGLPPTPTPTCSRVLSFLSLQSPPTPQGNLCQLAPGTPPL